MYGESGVHEKVIVQTIRDLDASEPECTHARGKEEFTFVSRHLHWPSPHRDVNSAHPALEACWVSISRTLIRPAGKGSCTYQIGKLHYCRMWWHVKE